MTRFAGSPLRSVALALGLAACGAPRAAKDAVEPRPSGAELYARTCAVCHGAAGEGYKADRAPALANPDFLATASDVFLRDAISGGRAGTTMSAWSMERGGPLTRRDTDALVAYIRGWERGPRPALNAGRPVGSFARGATLYAAKCEKCHGAKGVAGPGPHIGDAAFLKSASDGFLRYAIKNGRRGTEMAGFDAELGDAGVEDVLAALRGWQTAPPPAPSDRSPLPLGPVPLNPGGPEPTALRVYPLYTPADAIKGEVDRGAKLALLDARAPSDYMNGHIAGAVSVPFYDPSPYLSALPKDAWLICYCACPHAESGKLAQKLLEAGFAKVAVLDEGFNFWKSRGYPFRSGRAP
jgi:cytochrome c oxidase cbb3-type subunit 3/ubiquinol-cytochrome c reductase cytochrome c subunit